MSGLKSKKRGKERRKKRRKAITLFAAG